MNKITTYEIYVNGYFEEIWETRQDAVSRALNIASIFGLDSVAVFQSDLFEINWKEEQ